MKNGENFIWYGLSCAGATKNLPNSGIARLRLLNNTVISFHTAKERVSIFVYGRHFQPRCTR